MQISEITAPYKKKNLSLTQIKNLSLALSKIPQEDLLKSNDFNKSFEFHTKGWMGSYNNHKVHITTLFMHKPKLFSKLIDENSTFLKEFEKVNKIDDNNREYTPFYFLKTLENKTPELIKLALEKKLTVNVGTALYDIDDIYECVNFFNKTGINVVEVLCLYNQISIKEHLPSSMDTSYIANLGNSQNNKSPFILSILENELSRRKVIYPENDNEAAIRSASFLKNFETFKQMMGQIEIIEHNQEGNAFTLQILKTADIITKAEKNAEISFNKLAATLDNRFIERKIDAVITQKIEPDTPSTPNDRSFKL